MSSSSLHFKISEQLREKIVENRYLPGEQLPSEQQLMQQFQVSRITVRRAIANLVSQGLVESQQGKGVFVKNRQKVIRSLANPLVFFDEDMARQDVTSSIKSLSFEKVVPPSKYGKKLTLKSRELAYCQQKIILADNSPVAIDITYIRMDLGESFAQELQASFIYPTLDRHGIKIERVETILECDRATSPISHHLQVELGAPLLVNRYVAYTTGSQPLICGETISRADRLCYSIVLRRDRERERE
jgi:GntR family transcriptional regulator